MNHSDLFAASREVLWNVSGRYDAALMYSLLVLASILCGIGLWRRIKLWSAGRGDSTRFGNISKRFDGIWKDVLEQRGVNRDSQARMFHSSIFWGFLVLLFTTTMVMLDHDFGIKIYHGEFYLVVTVFSDAFGLILLLGVIQAWYRRYILRPDRLHNTRADALLLATLATLIVQGFFLEALRIHVTDDPWRKYSFAGNALSLLLSPLPVVASRTIHYVLWWLHTLTVFGFLALIPYTKFFHLLASSANLFFRQYERPKGALGYPGDIEQLLEQSAETPDGEFKIGVATIEDLTWKQRLDLDSCTSCGRCQDVCPAYNSGKALSPKWLILDARDHLLSLAASEKLGESAGGGVAGKIDRSLLRDLLLDHDNSRGSPTRSKRADNPLVQDSAIKIGGAAAEKIAGEVMEEDVFWSCVTCRACMEVCPVGIEHVDLIVDARRSLALIDGNIPKEAQNSLRAIETRGNPFGPAEQRASWSDGLKIKLLEPGDEVEVLYWVGCVSAYDKRKQKIARSMVKILNSSGQSWGMLGNREHCSGDPARRLGEENLFQNSAKKNVETLRSVKFKTLVANCPHCFNTLKNEYGQVSEEWARSGVEVVHHSVFIRRLMENGALALNSSFDKSVTFHDPCYLGRYNDVYEEPREILVQLGASHVSEMRQSKQLGKCCGAGGGHFWMDLKVGERINVQRVNQAAETGASVVATACPFCMQMMEDGAKLTSREEQLEVRDLAELVADAIVESAA